MFRLLDAYKEAFLSGLSVTLKLCLCVWLLGILVGSLLGVLGFRYKPTFGLMNSLISTVVSGIPIIVLLYWLYFPMQQILRVDFDPFWIAVTALSLVNIFMVSNVVSDAVAQLPEEYRVSAVVSGLSQQTFIRRIQIPLVIRQVIGPVLSIQLAMLHNSIFASLINVDDIFRQIQRVNALEYKPIELYSALALFFIAISVPLTLLANRLKKKYSQSWLGSLQ